MAYYPEGRYLVEVTGQGFGKSKEKGTDYFFLEIEPRYQLLKQGQVRVDKSYTREIRMYVTDKSFKYVVARLRSIGWHGFSFAELEPGGEFSFVGQEMGLECTHRQEDEYVNEKWEIPLTGGGGKTTESKSGISKKLDNLFGRQLRKTGKVESDSAPRPVENQTVPDEEDDIPF